MYSHIDSNRRKSWLLIVLFAGLLAAAGWVYGYVVTDAGPIGLAFALTVSLSTMVVRKAGTATLISTLSALFSFSNGIFIATGWNKVVTFGVAGLLFEFLFLMLKLEIHYLPLDILLGTALSTASIPLSTLFLLSTEMAATNGRAVMNILLLSFCVGLIGAVIAFLIWFQVKHSKAVLQYEYAG